MFTGIIEELGEIKRLEKQNGNLNINHKSQDDTRAKD